MRLPVYVVDAFASQPFKGNSAAVVPLESADQITDETRASIAAEMKHAETAYVVLRDEHNHYDLRWFSPTVEVALCGHATLASAHALWSTGVAGPLFFHTKSGVLSASQDGDRITLYFPAYPVTAGDLPFTPSFLTGAVFTGRYSFDWFVELASADDVRAVEPDFAEIERMGLRGLLITAKGDGGYDCVSRFFGPLTGVPEDSATGSAHCALGPYWSAKLGKEELLCYQASQRGGEVGVKLCGETVELSGKAVTVLEGQLFL